MDRNLAGQLGLGLRSGPRHDMNPASRKVYVNVPQVLKLTDPHPRERQGGEEDTPLWRGCG